MLHQSPADLCAAVTSAVPAPHPTPEWASGHVALAPYMPTPEITEAVDQIITLHRLRQGMLKAKTKLILQAKASVRLATQEAGDHDDDDAKDKARARADKLYAVVEKDETHPLHANLLPYRMALEPLEMQADVYAREMVKWAKKLPVYAWAKSVKGFGDVSFATIVGECGDIGSYKSVAAVWKRLGLAVMDGARQGNPGKGASAEDWIRHGYRASRRSVSWNARNNVIGGMGKWRPLAGDDLTGEDVTYYQRVYAERARYECEKLGLPIKTSDKGKESYSAHVANRAHRYVEKRLMKHLYIEWRRA